MVGPGISLVIQNLLIVPEACNFCVIRLHHLSIIHIIPEKMGLRMDDIHNPTVPSCPTSISSRPNTALDKEVPLMELMGEKERVESELSALSSVLDSVNHVCY